MLILPKKKQIFRETLRFDAAKVTSGETLFLGNAGFTLGRPKTITQKELDDSIMQLGFFGGSADSNKFWSDANRDNIIPKPEDYVDVPMRFISEAIVGGESWKATDFRVPGVLKASVPLLKNKTMYKNHEQEVDNWVGVVADPYYEPSFSQEAIEVPAGISGFARIDIKTNAKVARGLLMGAIQSNSVTPVMKWESSHSFETPEEFYSKIGTMASDGQMIRRMVLEVEDYLESSLVWLGADPFAKIKNSDGTLVNIDRSSVYFSKASDTEKNIVQKEKKFFITNTIDEKIISLSKQHYSKQHSSEPPKQDNNMKKFFLAFIAAFGHNLNLSFKYTDGMELSEAQEKELTDALSKLGLAKTAEETENINLGTQVRSLALAAVQKTDANATTVDLTKFFTEYGFVANATLSSLEAANTAITELTTALKVDVAQLKPTVVSLQASAELGKNYLTLKRDECKRLYGLSVGKDKEDAAVLEMIGKSEGAVLDGLLKQYGSTNSMKYSVYCSTCKSSDHIEMRSSIASEGDADESIDGSGSLSAQDMRDKYRKPVMFMNTGNKKEEASK